MHSCLLSTTHPLALCLQAHNAMGFVLGVCAKPHLILDMEGSKPGDDVHVGGKHAVSILIAPQCFCLITQPASRLQTQAQDPDLKPTRKQTAFTSSEL